MKIVELKLSQIKPYEKNPRKNDGAVDAVAESIRQFGFKVPIVIDSDNVIVCGHTRYKAAKQLKLATVPCVPADDLTPEQIKAYRLADNKVGELAGWDFDLLGEELGGIFDIDMSAFGFDLLEEELAEEDDEEEQVAVDTLPESRVLGFSVSAFGTHSECFMEMKIDEQDAEKLLEKINENGVSLIADKIKEAISNV